MIESFQDYDISLYMLVAKVLMHCCSLPETSQARQTLVWKFCSDHILCTNRKNDVKLHMWDASQGDDVSRPRKVTLLHWVFEWSPFVWHMFPCYIWHSIWSYVMKPHRYIIFFVFLIQNICFGYSKELSQWEGSFEHPNHIFKLIANKILAISRWNVLP